MKKQRRIILLILAVLVMSSFACSLGSITLRPGIINFPSETTVVEDEVVVIEETPLVEEESVVTTVYSSQEELFIDLYARAIKGVVVIQTYLENTAYGTGTGFVYDDDGHIVTNLHVVNNADTIVVGFETGLKVYAEVIGEDPNSDLAVLKVDTSADELFPLKMGDSSKLSIGQSVVAIGNPFGHNGSMTTGIVSALGRTLQSLNLSPDGGIFSAGDLVQTDAAINPGNSGGPLLNLAGEVIGVNRAIQTSGFSSTGTGQNSGVGFAISSNIVNRVVPELITQGFVDYPYLGITTHNDIPLQIAELLQLDRAVGVVIAGLAADGPAENAGLQIDDTIISMDGLEVKDFDEMLSYLLAYIYPGESVTIKYIRGGELQTTVMVIGARPNAVEESE